MISLWLGATVYPGIQPTGLNGRNGLCYCFANLSKVSFDRDTFTQNVDRLGVLHPVIDGKHTVFHRKIDGDIYPHSSDATLDMWRGDYYGHATTGTYAGVSSKTTYHVDEKYCWWEQIWWYAPKDTPTDVSEPNMETLVKHEICQFRVVRHPNHGKMVRQSRNQSAVISYKPNTKWEVAHYDMPPMPDWPTTSTGMPRGTIVSPVGYLDDSTSIDIDRLVSSLLAMRDGDIKGFRGEEYQQQLLRNCAEQVPHVDSNSIANALEILQLIRSIKKFKISTASKRAAKLYNRLASEGIRGYGKRFAKTLSDSWLKYRYAYCTTVGDVKSFIDYQARKNISKRFQSRMHASHTTYCCEMNLIDFTSAYILNDFYNLGIRLNWENAWDLIPFSFIVDWFTNFAEYAHQSEIQNDLLSGRWNIASICMSYKWQNHISSSQYNIVCTEYERIIRNKVPDYEVTWMDDYDPSAKTIIKRMLDGASLIISGAK